MTKKTERSFMVMDSILKIKLANLQHLKTIKKMIAFPNAKINLGLNIIEKRADGYHNIETVFYPIPLNDVLEVVYSSGDEPYTFANSGLVVDTPDDNNICIKALKLVKQEYEIPPVQIHLHKAIPFGAGLGGGSSDGAAMIRLLSQLFELGIPEEKQMEMAARLGADCAFFINNTPAFATGIGNILTPVPLSLKGYHLVLVKPDVHVSTVEAYRGVTPSRPEISVADIVNHPVSEWKNLLINDFEKSIFAIHPQLGIIKQMLYDHGAVYASMSGSGSTLFGLFDHQPSIPSQPHYLWQTEM